jgi:hypothetical protein
MQSRQYLPAPKLHGRTTAGQRSFCKAKRADRQMEVNILGEARLPEGCDPKGAQNQFSHIHFHFATVADADVSVSLINIWQLLIQAMPLAPILAT